MNRLEKVQMLSRIWDRNFHQSSLMTMIQERTIIVHYSFREFLEQIVETSDIANFTGKSIVKYDWTVCFFNLAITFKHQVSTLYPGKQVFMILYARDHKYLDYELLQQFINLIPSFAIFNYKELNQSPTDLTQIFSDNLSLDHYNIIICNTEDTAYKLTKRLNNSNEVWLVKSGNITKYENKRGKT